MFISKFFAYFAICSPEFCTHSIWHQVGKQSTKNGIDWLATTNNKPLQRQLLKNWWMECGNWSWHWICACINATILSNCADVPNPVHKSIENTRRKPAQTTKTDHIHKTHFRTYISAFIQWILYKLFVWQCKNRMWQIELQLLNWNQRLALT